MTAAASNMQGILDLAWEYLLPAMKAQALPADPAGQLQATLTSLALAKPEG